MHKIRYMLHLPMLIIQLTGLPGSGKSTLAEKVKPLVEAQSLATAIIDGDAYRKTLCKDLGFSKEDRSENIRRLGKAAFEMSGIVDVAIIAAINPFESIRSELKDTYGAKTVWLKCDLEILKQRDPKGLYKRALLNDDHPEKIFNLTGVDDPYEIPSSPELIIDTGLEVVDDSVRQLFDFIVLHTP